MSTYYSIPNWGDLQHYKDRTPPWIKLHNELLEDYEFECLPDASKAHLLCIWLLASRTNNQINTDPKWIERRICANESVNLKLLVEKGFLQLNQGVQDMERNASKALHNKEHDACLEREGEREEEREEEEEKRESKEDIVDRSKNLPAKADDKKSKKFVPPTLEELTRYMGEYAVSKQKTISPSEPENFINFYESKGWIVGNKKMVSWQASARGWIGRINNNSQPQQRPTKNGVNDNNWVDTLIEGDLL